MYLKMDSTTGVHNFAELPIVIKMRRYPSWKYEQLNPAIVKDIASHVHIIHEPLI